MTGLVELGFVWRAVACFGLTLLSGVFPWMNAEIIVLALPAVSSSPAALIGLLLAATAGQMTGKCIIYWTGRGGLRHGSPRMSAAVERWRGRIQRLRLGPTGLIFLSSSVGIPPFFVVTAIAGALRVNFPRFLLAGTAGRLVRFGALISVPEAIGRWT